MRLYDTHCHFENVTAEETAAILRRAKAAGVEKLTAIGGCPACNESALLAARIAADGVDMPVASAAVGYDREHAERTDLPPVPAVGTDPKVRIAAHGEIGLDYHYAPETRAAQLKFFGEQLEEARRRELPVVIHTRESDDDTVALLKEIPSTGIIHCYTGTRDYARQFLDLGFYVSISGIVTFKSAENVREIARYLPDDRILIETDSPFLSPIPMRGQTNEPAYIRHTCEFLANLRGLSPDQFAELTFVNGERILG